MSTTKFDQIDAVLRALGAALGVNYPVTSTSRVTPTSTPSLNRRGCSGCAERYPLTDAYHVLPNGALYKCQYATDD